MAGRADESRRKQALSLREAGLSYAEIGRRLGLTRERVRQILKPKRPVRKPDFPSRLMLSISEAAGLLGVHPNTLRRWADAGLVRAYRLGPRGDRRFRRTDIEELLKGSPPGR